MSPLSLFERLPTWSRLHVSSLPILLSSGCANRPFSDHAFVFPLPCTCLTIHLGISHLGCNFFHRLSSPHQNVSSHSQYFSFGKQRKDRTRALPEEVQKKNIRSHIGIERIAKEKYLSAYICMHVRYIYEDTFETYCSTGPPRSSPVHPSKELLPCLPCLCASNRLGSLETLLRGTSG
jgi:hypothetical protein